MNGKVSIIVPIYNTAVYLSECIESIIQQTYNDIEIILIDDGSTDNSLNICKTYAKKDPRIMVSHQNKNGVSVARNLGISIASGNYIVFVDSDDTLPKESVQNRVDSIRDSEMVVGMYTTSIVSAYDNRYNQVASWTKEEALEGIILSRPYQGYIWNKLFLKEIIEKYNIRFSEKIEYNEDRLFCVEYVLHCEKINLCHENVYTYRINQNSVMAKVGSYKDNEKKRLLSDLVAFDQMMMLLKTDYPIYYYKTATEAHKRTLQLKRLVSTSEKRLQSEFDRKLFQYLFIVFCGPSKAVPWRKKIKLLSHTLLRI